MGRRGGSYATEPGAGYASAVAGSDEQEASATLSSVQNNDGEDWPVAYSTDYCIASGAYFAPTRTNQLHYIYSWRSNKYRGRALPDSAMLHICTQSPSRVANNGMKDKWDGVGSGLDSEKLGIVKTIPLYMPSECVIAHDWLSVSDYPDCYAVIEMICSAPYEETPNYMCSAFNWTPYQLSYYENVIGSAPSLTYDASSNVVTVGTSMNGRRILEFRDTSATSPTGITDEETLMSFYLGSLINLEGYGGYQAYYHSSRSATLERWRPGTYSVSLKDTVKDGLSNYVSSGVDNAITQLNSVLWEFGIQLKRVSGSGGDIQVEYGTMSSLWGESVGDSYTNFFHGGEWKTITDADGYVTGAEIGIAREANYYTTFSQVCFEELYECFGCGYDQWEYPYDTTTLDMGGPWNPDYVTNKDADMLRLVYSDAVNAGDDPTTVALAHNIPKGVKLLSNGRSNAEVKARLDFLNPNRTYEIRVWIIDSDGTMSATSSWITITTPEKYRPEDWQWVTTVASGKAIALTAQEWTDFCSRINEFRVYTGFPEYGAFVSVSPGTTISAEIVDHAVWAISAMGPPTSAPSGVSSGDTITAGFFNGLKNALNSIP